MNPLLCILSLTALAVSSNAQLVSPATELSEAAKALVNPEITRDQAGKLKAYTCNEFESKAHQLIGR